MRRLILAAAVVVSVAPLTLLPGAARAHHSFTAEFSRDLPIEVTGSVTKVEWMNPHARFYVETKDENGETVEWDFELTSPNVLMRRGWTRSSLNPGDNVTVTGWRARNAPHVGNADKVVLADGREALHGLGGAAVSVGRWITLERSVLGALAAAALAAAPAQAQTRVAAAATRPDLSGIWQALGTANWELEAHAAEAGGRPELGTLLAIPPGPGVVVGGTIPYLPSALEKREENRRNRWSADPEIKCYMPGVPRANYMPYPFQIVQGTDTVMMSYQFADAVRIVYMNDPGPAPAPSWMGWSVGRWEGDTLVVDVTSQNDQTWLDRSGNYHSDALHVVERYTLQSPDVLIYEATLEDPNVFSRPWTIRVPLYRHVAENAQVLEFKCIPFAEDVLYGRADGG